MLLRAVGPSLNPTGVFGPPVGTMSVRRVKGISPSVGAREVKRGLSGTSDAKQGTTGVPTSGSREAVVRVELNVDCKATQTSLGGRGLG